MALAERGLSQRRTVLPLSAGPVPTTDCLNLAVLLFHLTLQLKIQLSFSLHPLLFHITYNALMHSLSLALTKGRPLVWLRSGDVPLYLLFAGSEQTLLFQSQKVWW